MKETLSVHGRCCVRTKQNTKKAIRMKSWALVVVLALFALSSALPVPEDDSSKPAASDEKTSGVANSLSQSTKVLVDTKTQLLKGLTGGAASSLQADASSNSESVQRNERANTGGYSSGGYPSTSYGPNTVAETPNNFLNVFSQAAANTVNFGTQLLNSLVGVAANILQGTVSTLLSLLNAKGQVVGAVVQSAPPVLASVTRTAGDVLAAKARIFGAVTQAAVSFGSQLARVFGDTFSGLLNRQGGEGGSGGSPLAQLAQLFSGLTSRGSGSSSGLSGSGSSPANLLGGVGNFAQTVINSKLNLLNGLLAPFTGGRPLLNFGNRGSSSSGSSSSSSSSSFSEPNFRISIASASTPNSISVSSPSDSSTKSSGPSGVFKGIVDQFNTDLQTRIKKLSSPVANDPILGSYDNSFTRSIFTPKASTGFNSNSKENTNGLDFSKLLPLAFANANLNNDYFNFN
ncbi:unnamed protein product [Allacma fusca]|uniref:Uncharacterized protein n=1 Tax=Allacma fusca TaxID=39272 RepID=A0A8J2J973_9HEXA|nr:unnamed protein product [Allacma fusca]